jgi:hypothetical protein
MEWLSALAVAGGLLVLFVVLIITNQTCKRKFFRWREGGDLWQFPWVGQDFSLFYGHLHLTEPGTQNLQDHIQWMHTYKDAFVMWAGPLWPVLSVCSAEAVQPILKSSAPKCMSCVSYRYATVIFLCAHAY